MSVEPYLRRGIFATSYCDACSRWVWPPSPRCDACHGKTRARSYSERGTILECSSRDGTVFCMCEFPGGIRVMGRLVAGSRMAGSPVVVSGCGMNPNGPFFEFTSV